MQVTLNWTAGAANGGTLSRYEYSSDGGTTWRTTGGTGVSYMVTQTSAATPVDLANGAEYTFRVRAVNQYGNGAASASAQATPQAATAPAQVEGLTATPGDGFVDLSWTEPSNGGMAITRYEYSTAAGTEGPWRTTGSASTSFRATQTSAATPVNLANGNSYTFRVRACNPVGCGSSSAAASATPNAQNRPPAFSADTASRSVDENESVGINVGAAVTATDPESDAIGYSITGANPGGFTVTSSGQIQTGQVLNHEAAASYTITLRAVANGGADTIAVTVTVNDINEAPAFASGATTRSVPENAGANTNVGTAVAATDPEGGTLRYTLSNGGGRFTIVESTGQIRVASGAALDYETTQSYVVTVRATDTGNLFGSIGVTINVTDVVEAAGLSSVSVSADNITRTTATPTFALSNGDGANVTVYVRYRTPPGSGAWLDGGSVSTSGTSVSVDLSGLTPGAAYRVQGSLASGFTNTVAADFTTTANTAPSFPGATATRQVEENRLAGAIVGDPVTAADADNDTLTYTMSGADAAAFEINESTGQITVGSTTALDYETKATYRVTVTAADAYDARDSIAVTIEVLDVREAGMLGRIVTTVGRRGGLYGFDSGAYGHLDGGSFPGALFRDGASRTVAEVYEDADGYWYFTYSGGLANDWLDVPEELDEITVNVAYEDGRDARSFVLGGFIDSRPGNRGLKLDPPLPARDWGSRNAQEVAIEFRRHQSQATAQVFPPPSTEPPADPGSFVDWLQETTPGGGVVAQMLIVIVVYVMFMFKAPPTTTGVIIGAICLILTPWVPTFFGFGDPILAAIMFVNVLAGAFSYKAFVARTEA